MAKLTASDAEDEDYFGWSVAIDGATIVVAAKWDDDAGDKSGSAYVFRSSDGWDGGTTYDQVAKLTAADGAANDAFGGSVAIDGVTIVVGACCDDDGGSNSGSAYVFEDESGWWDYFLRTRRRAALLLRHDPPRRRGRACRHPCLAGPSRKPPRLPPAPTTAA